MTTEGGDDNGGSSVTVNQPTHLFFVAGPYGAARVAALHQTLGRHGKRYFIRSVFGGCPRCLGVEITSTRVGLENVCPMRISRGSQ